MKIATHIEFPTHKQYKIQKQSLKGSLQKLLIYRKSLLNPSPSGNVVKIVEKTFKRVHILVYFLL